MDTHKTTLMLIINTLDIWHRLCYYVWHKTRILIMKIRNTYLALLLAATASGQNAKMELSLDQCIAMARKQSVEAAMCIGELKSAYWEYRSHRADLKPEISISADMPTYQKRYSTYQNYDGSYSYVMNDNLGMDASVQITQKIAPTGGTVTIQSSLDYMKQLHGQNKGEEQFMTVPVAITLNQPLFATNYTKWDKKIEPVRYKEAKARFLSETEQVAMSAINRFFSLIIANENVNIAQQNVQSAEKLYEVAIAKREMGSISENDVLQMRLQLLKAQSALTNAISDQQTNMYALCSFLNVDAEIVPIVPEEVPQVTLETEKVLSKALENNSFAHNILRRQLQADYYVAQAKGNMRNVNLRAQLGYTGTNHTLTSAYNELKSNQVVSVSLQIPIVDWGKRRGRVKVAESNRDITRNQLRQETQQFNQNIFVLTQQFNNQREQLQIAQEADIIAQKRYRTNEETFKKGSISTLELSDALTAKDEARRNKISQLFSYWHYYYQVRSLTLWDFSSDTGIDADFENIVK